ncbi:hypothetical protein Tco_1495149 [Tanacetum coccineum]
MNESDEYAYSVLEWIRWVRLPSIGMDRMGMPTQYWNGSDGSLYRHHCVVMISILVTPRVSALAGCDRLVSEPLVIEKYSILEDSKEEPIEEGPFEGPKEEGQLKIRRRRLTHITFQILVVGLDP